MGANPQGAEQAVGVHQAGAEDFGQLAARQAAQHFHLEQAVLGVDETQGAVHIGFVASLDVRHASLVVADGHRGLEMGQGKFAVAQRLLAFAVPDSAAGDSGDDDGQGGQGAFHARFSLLWSPHSPQAEPGGH
ncbi:hypothetical protein D9M69_312860 [compost metagenome]